MSAAKRTAGLPIDSPDRRRLPLLLRGAWYGLNRAFRHRIVHLGITPDQFTVMRTLLENEGITQRELTQLMTSDPNTVASLLERMERAGLIERHPHETDRRAHRIRLKASGKMKYASSTFSVESMTWDAELSGDEVEHGQQILGRPIATSFALGR